MRVWPMLVWLAGCHQVLGLQHIPDAAIDAPPPRIDLARQTMAMASSDATLSATLPQAPTPQSLIVMIGADENYSLMTPTGGGVAAWHAAASSTAQSNVEIWYGISDGTNATVTIQCQAAGPMWMSLTEWHGLDPSSPLDGGLGTNGSTKGTATGGPLTTTSAPDLVVFAASQFGAFQASDTPSPGAWTSLQTFDVAGISATTWYLVADVAGMQTASIPTIGSWDAAIAGFRAAP